MLNVKEGSKWTDGHGNVFHVLSVNTVEDHEWVHYIKEEHNKLLERLPGENEYSCYLESFVSRFTPIPV
jgi:hypothetical protein